MLAGNGAHVPVLTADRREIAKNKKGCPTDRAGSPPCRLDGRARYRRSSSGDAVFVTITDAAQAWSAEARLTLWSQDIPQPRP